jgi:DNA-binding protein H-NS
MKTYAELLNEAKALQQQAEELRRTERAAAIATIKQYMAAHQITVQMLKTPTPKPAKYVGPNGEKWAGGAGRRPAWVKTLMAQGADLEQYRVVASC